MDDFGGGIYSIAGHLSIIESLVQGNVTNTTRGGAMHVEGSLYVSNSRILDNYAGQEAEELGFAVVLE